MNNNITIYLFLILTNYFAGSISSAVLITKYLAGKDIRKIGYKTAGGSNVAHNMGIKWGLLVGVFDLLKGFPVLIVAKYLNVPEVWQVFIAVAAVIGHCWPLWFNFSGGRGMATLIGVSTFLYPKIAIYSIIIFLFSAPISVLQHKKKIGLKWLGSPIITLISLFTFLVLTLRTDKNEDTILMILMIGIILFRRLTANINDYKKYSLGKLLLSRLLFDNSETLM